VPLRKGGRRNRLPAFEILQQGCCPGRIARTKVGQPDDGDHIRRVRGRKRGRFANRLGIRAL